MSKWIHPAGDVTINEAECFHMVNGVCCFDLSSERGDYVDHAYCVERCPHFTREREEPEQA